jgi:sulfatase modifying factor 1
MAVWQYLGWGRSVVAASATSGSGARRGASIGWLSGGAFVATVACSGAGGSPDADPFPAAGAAGAPVAAAGTGGAPALAQGGSAGQPAEENLADTPGDLIEDEPEPPPPEPVSTFPESPSCEGSEPDACHGESCCTREDVTTGELMVVAPNVTVDLSPYALDKFEVSVARFRRFMAEFDDWRDLGNPGATTGAHPQTPGSGWVSDPAWEVALAGSAAVLRVGLNCSPTQQTWTDEPAFNENKPVNCVSWYEAFAFCVWDDGRLPTEAEWQYAAVGGAQARMFAWGNTPLTDSFASFNCRAAGTGSNCTVDDIPDVGSRPDGDGRFNHSDLVGSLYEWTLDWYAPYPELMRDDYAKTDMGTARVLRGGAWSSTTTQAMLSTDRSLRMAPTGRSATTGIRCAREAKEILR